MDSIEKMYAKLELDHEGWSIISRALYAYKRKVKERRNECVPGEARWKYYDDELRDIESVDVEVDNTLEELSDALND